MDTIIGGYIAADGVVKLSVDVDKVGYVILPNKTVLETVTGVLDSTNTGIAGELTYYIPKDNAITDISQSEVEGDLYFNGDGNLQAYTNHLITSFNCGAATIINLENCNALTSVVALAASEVATLQSELCNSIIAPNAYVINAINCALTAQIIGEFLQKNYVADSMSVYMDFSGGNNALEGAVNSYLVSNYAGLTYATVYALLVTTNSGTILIDVA